MSEEKAVIRALHGEKTYQETADTLKRLKNAVFNYLQPLKLPRKSKKVGSSLAMTPTLKIAIIWRASTGRFKARDLKEMFNAPVGVRRVQQAL